MQLSLQPFADGGCAGFVGKSQERLDFRSDLWRLVVPIGCVAHSLSDSLATQ